MCEFRMDLAKIQVTRVEGYDIQYLSMRKSQVYVPDTDMSDGESSFSSDSSSGSSGEYDDLPEDNADGYNSDFSDDSERTIGYDLDTYQSNTPGCSKDCAIIIDEDTQDVPVDLQVPEEDLVDVTGDLNLSESRWKLNIPSNFAANLRDIVERRKRKANEEDSFNHPLIEFEAKGKGPLLYLSVRGFSWFYNAFIGIRVLITFFTIFTVAPISLSAH